MSAKVQSKKAKSAKPASAFDGLPYERALKLNRLLQAAANIIAPNIKNGPNGKGMIVFGCLESADPFVMSDDFLFAHPNDGDPDAHVF
jgi:hypothetical protein